MLSYERANIEADNSRENDRQSKGDDQSRATFLSCLKQDVFDAVFEYLDLSIILLVLVAQGTLLPGCELYELFTDEPK